MRFFRLVLLPIALVTAIASVSRAFAAHSPTYFAIQVVDSDTGRGVPMVELRTVNSSVLLTDSNGQVALFEPGLMGQEVFFFVKSHGYEFPKDGFGFHGTRLRPEPGGKATLKLRRLNVAQRLYRVTGEGIYRDSALLGLAVPLQKPLLNGLVVGQDSVHTVPYRGKIFWIWGDTSVLGYPLGNFGTAGATSELPGKGGLDPTQGVNLTYFVDKQGASRPMVPREHVPGPGPIWLTGLTTMPDTNGHEQLIAGYARMESLAKVLERGLVVFDDDKQAFQRLAQYDPNAPLHLDGHPFRVQHNGSTYLYCGASVPSAVRVAADWKSIQDLGAYEGYTCLAPSARFAKEKTKLDRSSDGRLLWGWKKDTPPLSQEQQEQLVAAGLIRCDEAWMALRDIDSGKPVRAHAGSISWNAFLKRWVAIFAEIGGTSMLGETWYAEADTPIGPWAFAKKVVTHDRYSFYNPTQHPWFEQEGGRVIYFEGTYTAEFSGNPEKTPRYDYNQIMYRLDLVDPRLALPAPVYQVKGDGGTPRLMLRDAVDAGKLWDRVEQVAFFAVPPDRKSEALLPVYAFKGPKGIELQTHLPDGKAGDAIFFAAADSKRSQVAPLYEFRSVDGVRQYSVRPEPPAQGWQRGGQPVCYVWQNPPGAIMLGGGESCPSEHK